MFFIILPVKMKHWAAQVPRQASAQLTALTPLIDSLTYSDRRKLE